MARCSACPCGSDNLVQSDAEHLVMVDRLVALVGIAISEALNGDKTLTKGDLLRVVERVA